jgi:hypothetical protein
MLAATPLSLCVTSAGYEAYFCSLCPGLRHMDRNDFASGTRERDLAMAFRSAQSRSGLLPIWFIGIFFADFKALEVLS